MIPRAAERYNSTLLTGDYAAVASALGLYSERVEAPEELIPAFLRAAEATRNGKPALLDIICAKQPYIPYGGEDLQTLQAAAKPHGYTDK
jgi:thiamine pyrophosphate-dependent acetolactate synthase large subunit-like protein